MSNRMDARRDREHGGSTHAPMKRRHAPFTSVLLVGLLVVPGFGILLRLIRFLDPDSYGLILWCDLFLLGVVLPLAALGVGFHVTGRKPFVVWHAAATAELFAVASSVTVSIGWPDEAAPWWVRALAVVKLPTWWIVVHLFGSLTIALTWLLYRTNALRASSREEGANNGTDTWGELLGLAKTAPRTSKAVIDAHAVEVPIDTNGVPIAKIQATLPQLEEAGHLVRGRSSVIGGERGGTAMLRMVHTDPMSEWRIWPGLSHPGQSFALPFRTAYYSTGETQWYSFARTPDGVRSRLAPDFAAPNDALFGRQGATRAGKSGDIQIEAAEALSRSDAVLLLANAAKLRQDSGWCLDMTTLAADSQEKARILFAGLRRLGEYRSGLMGEHGFRTMTPKAHAALGIPFVLLQVDEGDLLLSGTNATWLATKGLSLGIYTSISISRAATDGMASTLRSAVSQWKCFGAGQDYDKGFVLSDETIAAGANPEKFGTRFPGAHYLDRAQGVEERYYPIDARSFQTRQDFADLRQAVEAARVAFTPATFTPGEIEALGDAWKFCQPRAALQLPVPTMNADDGEEEKDMQETQPLPNGGPPDGADDDIPEDAPDQMRRPREDVGEYRADFGDVDPNEERPDYSGPSVTLTDDKPRVSSEQAVAEFDAALVRLARRGLTDFSNSDVIEEMRVAYSESSISRRLHGLCEGDVIPPEGLTVERLGRGAYRLLRMEPAAA